MSTPNGSSIPPALAQAHAALMKHGELQFDFPRFTPPEMPAWLVWLAKILKPIAPYLGYIMWAIVIAAVAMVLFLIFRSLVRRGVFSWRRKAKAEAPPPDWRPAPDAARHLLSDADALAAAGRYAEAIHLILLRSIQDIGRYRPAVMKPALTSREISALEEIPQAARTAFAHIAAVVERAIFAGRPVGRAEYVECRAAYERFAFPESWSLARAA